MTKRGTMKRTYVEIMKLTGDRSKWGGHENTSDPIQALDRMVIRAFGVLASFEATEGNDGYIVDFDNGERLTGLVRVSVVPCGESRTVSL